MQADEEYRDGDVDERDYGRANGERFEEREGRARQFERCSVSRLNSSKLGELEVF